MEHDKPFPVSRWAIGSPPGERVDAADWAEQAADRLRLIYNEQPKPV